MKLDNILLLVVGVVIVLILLGLGVGVFMIFFGGGEPPQDTLVKYQCYDGDIVSKLSDCPKVSTTRASVSTIITSGSCPTVASCPKCDCITRPTTSPPTTLCVHCTTASGCGQAYSELICKSGESGGVSYDTWEVTYTPACTNGCCIWTSSRAPKSTCTDTEICVNGTCVLRPETGE